MTARQINLALWFLSATLGCLSIAAAALGILLPLESAQKNDQRSAAKPTTAPSNSSVSLPPLESFNAIVARPLRQPLVDVPNTETPAAVKPVASMILPPPITLVGTIGNTTAMLRTPDGAVSVTSVGDQVAGARLLAIRESQVDVRFNGRKYTLAKGETPQIPGTNQPVPVPR